MSLIDDQISSLLCLEGQMDPEVFSLEQKITFTINIKIERHFEFPFQRELGFLTPTNLKARKNMIITGIMHKMKQTFFSLVQNEDGDIFKITFVFDEDRTINRA